MDLKTFLLARIAEDEAVALAATKGPWRVESTGGEYLSIWCADNIGGLTTNNASVDNYPDATHIARHDPARVLAECAAKREIVEGWEDPATVPGWYGERGEGAAENLDGVVRALAAVYADHPDYQPEWAA